MSESRLYLCQHSSARRGYATPSGNCQHGSHREGDACVWRLETDEERDARQRRTVLNGEPAAHLEAGR